MLEECWKRVLVESVLVVRVMVEVGRERWLRVLVSERWLVLFECWLRECWLSVDCCRLKCVG